MGSLGGRGARLAALRHHRHVLRGLPARGQHAVRGHLHVRAARDRARDPPVRHLRAARVNSALPIRPSSARSPASRSRSPCSRPLLFSAYTVDQLLTQVLIFGIVAMSLIFLASYGGMVSLAQTALFGIAGFVFGNMTTVDTKGLDARLQPVGRHHPGDPDRDRDRPHLRRARLALDRHLLPHDHADLQRDREPLVRADREVSPGFGGISGIVPPVDHRHDRPAPAPPLLPLARRSRCCSTCSCATSYARRSASRSRACATSRCA